MRADFNGSAKGSVDRVRQIRIGINDVPYNMLPRVVPAVPTGYTETEAEAEQAWNELIGKMKELILASFDRRVSQYEEDIKEKDAQRALPGWNFCTFFILKEGLARGFESVGLVEDALVVYDELSVGLDSIVAEQASSDNPAAHGGALLSYTEELKDIAQKALAELTGGRLEFGNDEEEVTLDAQPSSDKPSDAISGIPISTAHKPYRDLILANNVSLFDFRCYIFARQTALLLRLANAWSSREELLAKLKEQQELAPRGVAPRNLPSQKPVDEEEPENLLYLAEICRRTLEFVPGVSQVMRADVLKAMGGEEAMGKELVEVVDNMVASFAFSVAQQILAQTSTKLLPIPPSVLGRPLATGEAADKVPELRTTTLPVRSSSLREGQKPPPSPGFPGPGRLEQELPVQRAGLEELAAQRAELCNLSRNVLEECGKKRGWTDGWAGVPTVGETGVEEMEDIPLDGSSEPATKKEAEPEEALYTSTAGVSNATLRTALDNRDDFYRLYETLIDKALRHFTLAGHTHSVQASMADLAVLKYHLGEYAAAAGYFYQVIPFFGESGWSLLELSLLVMYARCLKELGKVEDYVNKALRQLLCKAAAAEKERLASKSRVVAASVKGFPDVEAVKGFLGELITSSTSLERDVRIPLTSLFCKIAVDGPPWYDEAGDGFSLFVDMYSLLVDEFEADSVRVRIVGVQGATVNREIWLSTAGKVTIHPGPNKIRVRSTVMMAGAFEADQIRVQAKRVVLHYERDAPLSSTLVGATQQPARTPHVIQNARVVLYHRTSALDVVVSGPRHLQLDKRKFLDLELHTGWNELSNVEIRVRAATGGLRLLTHEAELFTSRDANPTKPATPGIFAFSDLAKNVTRLVRLPFTVEQDVVDVTVRVEVSYTTVSGTTYTLHKTASVPIALALEVNVQDIFKHDALFSRFAVAPAQVGGEESPLRVVSAELKGSDIFEAEAGVLPEKVVVFGRQPASLLWRIKRKKGVRKAGPGTTGTLYLRLGYTVLMEELDLLVRSRVQDELKNIPSLSEMAKAVAGVVVSCLRRALDTTALERVALLGELDLTNLLQEINWERVCSSLGLEPPSPSSPGGGGGLAPAAWIRQFITANPVLIVPETPVPDAKREITIPVDVPSVAVVHTADIKLHCLDPANRSSELFPGTDTPSAGCPVVRVNQVLEATLHLRWTRRWDTSSLLSSPSSPLPVGSPNPGIGAEGQNSAWARDLEFGYEVTAPGDTWIIGGRRKGHFVIPSVMLPTDGKDEPDGISSTPDTEAHIPLVLIPLREGYLPLPTVEIREVSSGENGEGNWNGGNQLHCETDYRNLGETVCVVPERERVTLALDVAGPGGSPVVLECEGGGWRGGRGVV